jgi:hypothetical protein
VAETSTWLRGRVSDLDAEPEPGIAAGEIDTDLAHAVWTLGRITAGGPHEEGGLTPAEADLIASECALLHRLGRRAPEVTRGPLRASEQLWIGTGGDNPPEAKRFAEAAAAPAAAKPERAGLFTSTRALGTFGMWWCYLELRRGASGFPPPWTVWRLDVAPGARVLSLASAADWAAFVKAWPRRDGGVLYPDWARAAERWDGVHVALGAIVASQGLHLEVSAGTIAPAYWDVETTVWLRWSFRGVGRVAPPWPRARLPELGRS